MDGDEAIVKEGLNGLMSLSSSEDLRKLMRLSAISSGQKIVAQ
jgi:hypothetical protein